MRFTPELLKGKAGDYYCVSVDSLEGHLREVRRRMNASDDLIRLKALTDDWLMLLDARHKFACRYCGRP